LWFVYAGLTLALVVLLVVCGMGPYDAVVHALTTLAAGGFSPNAQSLAGYANPMAEWVLVVFMMLAGTSFVLQVRVFSGRPLAWTRDGEFLFYCGVAAVISLMVACVLAGGLPGETELRLGAFQVASLISSTGYASVDYEQWPDGARALLIVAMVVGGCAGSAAGGPKAVRILIMIKRVFTEIRRVLHPRAVLRVRYRAQPVEDDIMRAITALVALFLTGYVLVGVALVVLGADLVTGFTAALACLGNIGPGFGVAGPMGNYADFSLGSKIVLTLAMWLGRLEIIPVLALLHPDAWRGTRLRA